MHHVLVLALLAQEQFEFALVHVVEHAREPRLMSAVAMGLNQTEVKEGSYSLSKVTVGHLDRLLSLDLAVGRLVHRDRVKEVEVA